MENILSMTKIENGTDFIEKKQEVIEDLVYEGGRPYHGPAGAPQIFGFYA